MFAPRITRLRPSLVREILAAAQSPGMISFAGGLPATETLYAPDWTQLQLSPQLLQYGPSEGEPQLRALVAERARHMGLDCSAEQVLILNGSQQGIDLVAKLWVSEGTRILCESPTYLAALQVFELFGADMQPGTGDAAGLLPAAVTAEQAEFAYLIPTFQNPTGLCYPAERRAALAAAFDQAGLPVFEDDPYRDLAFDGTPPAPLVAGLRAARWVYQGSFSKTLAPGLRLGYLIAHPDLLTPLTRLKQAADLHSNRLSQGIVTQVLATGALQAHLEHVLPVYRAKRDAMQAALQRELADEAEWECPAGGLFFWLRLRRPIDALALMQQGLAQGLAVMPGQPFYAQTSAPAALRLNFSHSSLAQIEAGVATLARLIRQAPALAV
ncbi:PLP-dependent aminotransferase family protein [Chitinibacter sp. ZOR0017]|uniref:aminotransferase-like domain-containing protein n=1 Tax=Chitinibacter sp. ZOR0017 TaxID=1339254 RepID=UPI0006481BDC|nr:PLP-dependent aminotransferase family protein [Chitinibacter sp. ZOR0017]